MTIRLWDSRAQALVDFVPLEPGRVGLYVCGPTVQSSPHIGHLRSALVYDLWRRWFAHRGLEVTLVRNVTDIDDKVLALAAETSEEWWARAYRVELEFTAGYARLGVLPPTYEPRATASIGEMQQIVQRLLDRGHAYVADDGSGDVWFDTASWEPYGELTRQGADDTVPSADAGGHAKRDPRDFALWKGRKDDEPASANWPSPWGEGRPGWHIECSAMSRRYLGAEFDIHGGGLDLRFPHHENELAQSTAAGDGFARHWLHNGLVAVEGQKMSKSLGNSVFAAELLEAARPVVVRYFLSAAHYRSTIDYHDGALDEAEAALDRVETFLVRAERRLAETRFAAVGARVVPEAFGAAMDDDLNVPQALAVLHDAVRSGNSALDDDDLEGAAREWQHVQAMVAVLGIDPTAPEWRVEGDDAAHRALGVLADVLLAERQRARAERDFARADEIRAQLTGAGITIEDTPSGSHWSLEQ